MALKLLELAQAKIQQTADYFNPTSNAGNNFWSSGGGRTLGAIDRLLPVTPMKDFTTGLVGNWASSWKDAGQGINTASPDYKSSFVPQNQWQKMGSEGTKLLADLVSMQNSGLNTPIEKGIGYLNATAHISPTVGPALMKTEDLLARAGNKIVTGANKLLNKDIQFANRPGMARLDLGYSDIPKDFAPPKPIVGRTDIKTLYQNIPEFQENPTMLVEQAADGTKLLTFNGKASKFSIKPQALGLSDDVLSVGDDLNVGNILKQTGSVPTVASPIDQTGKTSALFTKPAKKEKFSIMRVVDGKSEVVPAKSAEVVYLNPELKTFIHKTGKNQWSVTEARSGSTLGWGVTRQNALANANKKITEHGVDKVKSLADDFVSKHGEANPSATVAPPTQPKGGVPEGGVTSKTFIHETNAPTFDKFDLSKAGTGQGEAWLGKGVYLTEKGSFKLEQYGKNKIEASLSPNAKIFEVTDTPNGTYRDNFVEYAVKNNIGRARGMAEARTKEGLSLQNLLPRDILRNDPEAVAQLRKAGFDGLLEDGELVVYNPDVLKINKPISPQPEGGVLVGVTKTDDIFTPQTTGQLAKGTENAPLKTTERYFKPAGSRQADFIAGEEGIAPVTELGPKKTAQWFKGKEVPTEVKPGVGGALPEGNIKPVGALPEGTPPEGSFEEAVKTGSIFRKKSRLTKMWEDLTTPSKTVIGRSGKAGKQITTMLKQADDEIDNVAGTFKDQLNKAMKGFNRQERETFAEVVEGTMKPISARQAIAVKRWNQISKAIADMADQTGIEMKVRQNYFPHFTEKLTTEQKQALAQQLVNDKVFGNIAEAMAEIEKVGSSLSRFSPRSFSLLEKARTLNLPYKKDPQVLYDYIDGAVGRITQAKHFGLNDEKLYQLADTVSTQGGDSQQVIKYLNQILGKEQEANWSKAVTSAQTVMKLNPGTSVLNLTQNLSTAVRTDIGTSAKVVNKLLTNYDDAVSVAVRANEISPETARLIADSLGSGDNVARSWIKIIGMEGTEKFNRIFATNAGYEYATKLASQYAKNPANKAVVRELERLGIKTSQIVDGKLADDILVKAGRQVSRETQFLSKPGELPYGWRTNLGKVVTQFKSFAYKQTGFAAGQAKRMAVELVAGNAKPLLNALVVAGVSATAAGEAVNAINSIIKNKKREESESLAGRMIDNFFDSTSLGLLDSLGGLTGKYGEGGVISSIGGPTASDAYKVITGVSDAYKGLSEYDKDKSLIENIDPAMTTRRNIVKSVPGIGQTLANTFVPNSYVDNVVGGVNEGLSRKDTETYRMLKEQSPEKAEQFKEETQAGYKEEKNMGKKNVFSTLFGGGDNGLSKTATSNSSLKAQKTKLDEFLKNGGDPSDTKIISPDVIITHVFDGKSYDTATRSERGKILSKIKSLSDSGDYTDEQVTALAEVAKVDKNDMEYYMLATMPEADRIEGLISFAGGEFKDRNELVMGLAINKRIVGGKYLLSTDITNRLYDEGLISKDEKALINAVKFDELRNKFYLDRDYVTTGEITDSQRTAIINKINTAFKVSTKRPSTTKPTLPKLPKLSQETTSKKSSGRWFRPY